MKPIPIYNFGKLSDADLVAKARHIVACMTGNLNYPDATARVTKVETSTDDFEESYLGALDGGKTKKALRDKKRKVLEKALKELALYVQLNCNDDLAIMLSSGYDGKSDGEPIQEPGAPEEFTVELGPGSGTVTTSVAPHKKIRIYVFEYAEVPANGGKPEWVVLLGPRKRQISGLTLLKEYMFRSALKGKSDNLIYSDIIRRYIV